MSKLNLLQIGQGMAAAQSSNALMRNPTMYPKVAQALPAKVDAKLKP